MKRFFYHIIFVIIIAQVSGCTSSRQVSKTGKSVITMLSFNIRNGIGLDNVVNYKRTAAAISKINADIVAIQELDSATHRSKGVNVLNELATLTGMTATFHASINYDGGKYGIGILSKEKPLSIEGIALPGTEEKRSAVAVEMKNYIFVCTHFSLTEKDRDQSVTLINQLAAKYTKPVFLAGDLNTKPGSFAINSFSKEWYFLSDTTKFTIPANKPVDCIDYIMAFKNKKYTFKVQEEAVGNEPVASDHLPVMVKVIVNIK